MPSDGAQTFEKHGREMRCKDAVMRVYRCVKRDHAAQCTVRLPSRQYRYRGARPLVSCILLLLLTAANFVVAACSVLSSYFLALNSMT